MKNEMTSFSKTIFKERYAHPGEDTWDDLAKRVSEHVSKAESIDSENQELSPSDNWYKRFKKIISDKLFIPGGRILYGSGRNKSFLLNCFVLDVEDNRESIGQLFSDFFVVSGAGGGVGVNFSKLRPKGGHLSGIGGSSSGPISFMKAIDKLAETVRAGGSRRAALLLALDVKHPDILDFIDVKLSGTELTNANISIAFNQDFLDAVKNDSDWKFEFNGRSYEIYVINRIDKDNITDVLQLPATSEAHSLEIAKGFHDEFGKDYKFTVTGTTSIKAKYIWDKAIENQMAIGDPGFMNLGYMNEMNNLYYSDRIACTNPCGELPLSKNGSCCLGSINLSELIQTDSNGVNSFSWIKFKHVIHTAIRFLDDVLDVNQYPLQSIEQTSKSIRRVGLGVMGLHHMLIKLGYKYGEEECLEFIDRVFEKLRDEAYIASSDIAAEKGSFSHYNKELFLKSKFIKSLPTRVKNRIKKNGIRNAVLLTCAPTGTTSIVMGVSSGVEPIFSPIYKRRYYSGAEMKEELVADSLFSDEYRDGRPVDHIVGAYDITPEQHIAVQQTIQRYTDSSISKTINLPRDYSNNDISELLIDNLDEMKGTTFYRAGSRDMEPLVAIPINEIEDIDSIIKKKKVEVADAAVCKLGDNSCGN